MAEFLDFAIQAKFAYVNKLRLSSFCLTASFTNALLRNRTYRLTDALLLSRGEGSGNRVSHRQERLVGSRGEHEDVVARIDGIHHDDAQHILLRIVERDDGSAVEILHGRGRIDLGQTRLRLFGGHRRIHRGVGDDQAVRTVRGSGGKDIALGDLLVIQLNRLPVGRDIELEALSLNQLAFGGQVGQRELLRQDLLVRVPDGASIACFDGGEAFLSGFTPGDDALVFLDICMEGMNGIEVAQRVRKRSARCLIVFLTSSKEYAFDAFPVHPFDYLVKPYSAVRLDHVLSGAIRLMEESEQLVEIHLPRQTIRLPHGQIVAVTSHGHALDIFTVSGACLKSSQTFAELEAALRGDERFLPCNRGVLVNMDEALKLDGDSILLTDGLRFPLRQRNRLDLVNRFSEYQIKRMKRG